MIKIFIVKSKKIKHSVYIFIKKLSKKPDLTPNFFKCAQDLTSQACGISLRIVSRICSGAKKLENTQDEQLVVPFFKSPHKTYKRAKIQTELDDFDGDIVRRIIHDLYDRGEYPTTFSILNTYREKNYYTGSVRSMRRVLKNLNFSFKKCNDGRKCLMERLDIVALRKIPQKNVHTA